MKQLMRVKLLRQTSMNLIDFLILMIVVVIFGLWLAYRDEDEG